MANGAECPVDGCGFSDVPSLVAAHVNGTDDDAHDWGRLPFAGPGAFLSAVRSGESADRSGPSGVVDAPDEGEAGTNDGVGTAADPKSDAEPDGPMGDAEPDDPFDPEPAFRAAAVARERAAGIDALDDLDADELVDLFVAFSVLSSRASSVRSDVRSAILDRVDEEAELEGDLGSVDRSIGTRRSLRDEETVRRALARAGVDPREAEAFDPDRVGELAEAADVDEEAVFDIAESDHVRRAGVDEAAFDALIDEE